MVTASGAVLVATAIPAAAIGYATVVSGSWSYIYDTGPWSDICRFDVDRTAPGAAPVVSSKDYKDSFPGTGGVGVPGEFTVEPNGVGALFPPTVALMRPTYATPVRNIDGVYDHRHRDQVR
ncbi:hypothetical protein [Actinocrispum sp. NPDC049592]|uniref:hypothetical protein n=1 Tax=Actinocrispum sp. NPDC049592 TaxID=3154835 RepID=UPI0034373757